LRVARRRDLNAVVGHPPAPGAKGETGRFQTLARIRFSRKTI